jgi:hypothetical protein
MFGAFGTIFGTKSMKKKNTHGMIKNKIEWPYKLAVLRDRNGYLSRE